MSTPVPPTNPKMENYTNYQPDQEMHRLRMRVGELLRLGALTPETFQQTVMQVWQEGERRRQTCLQEAEEHLRRYHASISQASAFAAQSSILYSVVNGYVVIEERKNAELAERAREKAQQEAEKQELEKQEAEKREAEKKVEQAKVEPQSVAPAQEAAVVATPQPSGGRRRRA